jgi:hypothetical protein
MGTVETGLLWWVKGATQIAAAATARCGAIGYTDSTTTCVDTASTKSYAVSMTQPWLFSGMVGAADVTVNGKVSSCNGFAGSFFSVSVGSSYLSNLPPPLGNLTLSSSSCYPMP